MNQDDYISQRLDPQIKWYSSRSMENQKKFKCLRTIEIVFAAIVPFVAGMGKNIPYDNWVVGISGIIVAIAAGLIMLQKHHELWIQYRTTCEQLKHEKYLFLTACEPYDTDDAFKLLVARVEALISKENSMWQQSNKKNPPKGEAEGEGGI